MEWKQELRELYLQSSFGRLLGISLEFDEENHAHLTLPFKKDLTHEKGAVHGGVFATLLDDAGWFASAICHPGVWVTTSEFKVHLFSSVEGEELRAEGWLIKKGKRMDIAEMRVYAGDKVVAAGMGTYVILDKIAHQK